jgi:Domain of unknown function (DUF4836)
MKRKHVSLAAIAILAIITFASCKKKTNTLGKNVPKTAAFVAYIDGASINGKLPWAEIQATSWFKDALSDSTQTAYTKLLLQNPENTGVNVKGDMLFYADIDSTKAITLCLQGGITDAAKFKTLLAQDSTDPGKETSSEGYTIVTKKDGCVAYNKDKFYALGVSDEFNKANSYFDTVLTAAPVVDYAAKVLAIIKLDEGKSLAKDEHFTEMTELKGDMKFWYSAENLAPFTKQAMALPIGNLNKLYEGAVSLGVLNFDNGKIDLETKSYAGKELTEFYKKYGGGEVSETMMQSIPTQNPLAVIALNFKPDALQAFFKLLGMDGLVTMGLSQFGISFDDFSKANKGDVIFSLNSFDNKPDSSGGQEPSAFFAASIGDKASFNKMIDAGKKLGMGMGSNAAGKVAFNVNDKYFAIGTSKSVVDGFLNSTNKTAPAFTSKITGSPMGMYANIKQMIAQIKPTNNLDSIDLEIKTISEKFWDDAVLTGGEIKKDAMLSQGSVNLVDKTTNSLKQLNTYLDKLYLLNKKQAERNAVAFDVTY